MVEDFGFKIISKKNFDYKIWDDGEVYIYKKNSKILHNPNGPAIINSSYDYYYYNDQLIGVKIKNKDIFFSLFKTVIFFSGNNEFKRFIKLQIIK